MFKIGENDGNDIKIRDRCLPLKNENVREISVIMIRRIRITTRRHSETACTPEHRWQTLCACATSVLTAQKKRAGNYWVIYIGPKVPHNFPYYKNTTETLRQVIRAWLHCERDQAFFSSISATQRSLQTDFYKMFQFSTKFNQNVIGWSLVCGQPFHKLTWTLVQYSVLRYPGDRQTNKQTDRQTQVKT